MKERCQIVVNAKAFAEEKGLDSNEVNCSIENTCDGLTCQFVPEEKNSPATPNPNIREK